MSLDFKGHPPTLSNQIFQVATGARLWLIQPGGAIRWRRTGDATTLSLMTKPAARKVPSSPHAMTRYTRRMSNIALDTLL